MKPWSAGEPVTKWWAPVLMLPLAALFFYPFVWMALAMFKTNREVFRPTQVLPKSFDPTFIQQLLSGEIIPFWRVFGNSLLLASVQTIGAVAVTMMAGYAFAKCRVRGKRLWFLLAVTVIVVPRQVLAIPLFEWLNDLKLINSLWGVCLPGMVSGIGILFFTQVFRRVPNELIEVARCEGASEFRTFWTLLPLVRGSALTYGLIHFIMAWHEHLIPLMVLNSPDKQTLSLALATLYGSSLRFPYAVLMAGSVMTTLPTVVLFAILYRRFRTAMSDIMIQS